MKHGNGNGKVHKINGKIRYAVVGLGHIAQVAVLPAFKHASKNSQLTCLISDDKKKISELTKLYGVENTYSYDQFDEALHSGQFDAVYIALPNDMHKTFAIKAANAGIHILCEKPMAISEADCKAMISAADSNKVKLMIAYRLHFEKTNMTAVELVHSGKIGEPRIFNSTFCMQVREGNIRTQREHGGGPLFDIGIYCINAARYIFKEEPIEVMAITAQSNDPRFMEVEEAVGAILKFPEEKIASFICSFGAYDASRYEVIGIEGKVIVDPAYEYADKLEYELESKMQNKKGSTPKRDQFAPELLHFSDSIINDTDPRPSGKEGLADIRIIEAIQKSAQRQSAIKIKTVEPNTSKADTELVKEKPAVRKPVLVGVKSASKE